MRSDTLLSDFQVPDCMINSDARPRTASIMRSSALEPIDVVVAAEREDGRVDVITQLPGFPQPESVVIEFDRRLFESPAWKRHRVDDFTVLVRLPDRP